MSSRLPALLATLAILAATAAGCSSAPGSAPTSGPATGSKSGPGTTGATSPSGTATSTGRPAALAAATCWDDAKVGADPQDVRALSKSTGVPYRAVARAVAGRPAFTHSTSCSEDHAVEVYKALRLPELDARLRGYAALLRVKSPLYAMVSRSVAQACMSSRLAKAAARTRLPGAVMSPVLPVGRSVGWAPASPASWAAGKRVFACTLTWSPARSLRYASVFTRTFPLSGRTCIDTAALRFVDCSRRHDRERIAFIEARDAVVAGAFPGRKAIKRGPDGRYLDVPVLAWKKLDAGCTAYLHTISRTRKLTGVANVDVDQWPRPDGSFPIWCDADTRPDQDSLITTGSVYNR